MTLLKNGYTLVEIVLVVAITGLLVVALATFIGRSFNVTREQFEQARITEDGRLELERISDALRNARYVDHNGNGVTSDPNEHWLVAAEAETISVYTNIDSDAEAELIRYFIDDQHPRVLIRGVRETPFTGAETEQVVTRNLFNHEQGVPLFAYYASNGTMLTAPLTASTIPATARIGITFVVDVNPTQRPAAAVITTDVSPRSFKCAGGDCQGIGTGCFPVADTVLGPYAYTSDSFVEEGGQTCKATCQTPGVAACCPWFATYAWDGAAQVTGYCVCNQPALPSPLPDVVAYGDYTAYYKDKWSYCNSLGQYGTVICDPGCDLTAPTGSCTYQCQSQ